MNILVTGANEGIGYYMVAELLEQGNNLTILDIEILELLKLKEKYPGKVLPVKCDVRDTKGMQEAVKKSISTYSSIDIVVHNACRCTFQSMQENGKVILPLHSLFLKNFLADPKVVGSGLARRIDKNSYYICYSVSQHLQTRLCYLFPNKMGKMMSRLLKKNQQA